MAASACMGMHVCLGQSRAQILRTYKPSPEYEVTCVCVQAAPTHGFGAAWLLCKWASLLAGYDGLLSSGKRAKFGPEDRIFSGSSCSGAVGTN